MKLRSIINISPAGFMVTLSMVSALSTPVMADTELADTASTVARKGMMVDTHIDVPYRLEEEWEDVTGHTEGGDFDYERARRGGLDIPFMSIYTPAESEEKGTSHQIANTLIDGVEALVGRAPDKYMLVYTPEQAAQYAVEVLQLAMPTCERLGVTIGLEPLGPSEGDFLLTAESAIEVARQVNSPCCKLHLDVKAMSSESTAIPDIIEAS